MNDIIEHQSNSPVIQQTESSIMAVISRAACDPNFDVMKLEKLLEMQERLQKRDAQSAFNAAMAEMQCEIPTIAERAKGHGTIKYATLEDISDIVKPIMKVHGFAISFKVEHSANGLSVTGILMHRAGHREETTMLLPIDTSGSKNAVQAVGSSTSYGKRYVMCALLNITTRGEDDDAYSAAPSAQEPVITEAQAKQMNAVLAKCSAAARAKFIDLYGSADLVYKSNFDGVMAGLNKSAAANAAKEA